MTTSEPSGNRGTLVFWGSRMSSLSRRCVAPLLPPRGQGQESGSVWCFGFYLRARGWLNFCVALFCVLGLALLLLCTGLNGGVHCVAVSLPCFRGGARVQPEATPPRSRACCGAGLSTPLPFATWRSSIIARAGWWLVTQDGNPDFVVFRKHPIYYSIPPSSAACALRGMFYV